MDDVLCIEQYGEFDSCASACSPSIWLLCAGAAWLNRIHLPSHSVCSTLCPQLPCLVLLLSQRKHTLHGWVGAAPKKPEGRVCQVLTHFEILGNSHVSLTAKQSVK
eukprot:4760768-Amphidinium_carterae.2